MYHLEKGFVFMFFDPKKTKDEIVIWIREFFQKTGPTCNAIVGVSGGKDSSVVAALCSEALGRERVIGILMPKGHQEDINMAYKLISFLGIRSYEINIEDCYNGLMSRLENELPEITQSTRINLQPRLRMATLYAASQSLNGRVANTCNLSEDWVGYSTRYGDSVGDFSPLANITVREVLVLGKELGLPEDIVNKVPVDGLCGQTDEEKLGFTYKMLDEYIRTGLCGDTALKEKIDRLHEMNKFKLELMPCFPYKP